MGRHGLGKSFPGCERVSFFFGCGLGGDGRTVSDFECLVNLSVDHIGEFVNVGIILGYGVNIVRRHGLGKSFPGCERISFFFGCGLGGDGRTVGNFECLVNLSVDHIGEFVYVSFEAGLDINIVRDGDSTRCFGITVAPCNEVVSLVGNSSNV